MLFWVDIEGRWSICWYACLHVCRLTHLLIWYAPVVVMKCLRIMRVVALDMVYPPAQKIHGRFMKWIFWDFPLFIHFFRTQFLLLPLFLDIRPWYAPIFSSLPERDPRKSGVVVVAAKLTQVPISIQPIPILQVTPNNVLPSGCLTLGILLRRHFHPSVSHPEPFCAAIFIQVSHTRNPSAPPFPSRCLTPETFLRHHFHPGVSHPESFCAAISIRVPHTRNLFCAAISILTSLSLFHNFFPSWLKIFIEIIFTSCLFSRRNLVAITY